MTQIRKPHNKFVLLALGILLILLPLAACESAPLTKEPVRFTDGSWDSIQIHNRIAAFIIESGYGYPTNLIPSETITGATGLVRGDIDVNMELWVESMAEAYQKGIASGEAVDLGTNFPDSWQGWLVPAYMIDNGDLPQGIDVFDMPEYRELFIDPEDQTRGRFYSCVPGWECEKSNERKIVTYGLDKYYKVFHPGSEAALNASSAGAYQRGEPWFGYYWEPTWILGMYDMTPIEEPPYDKEIWEATRGCAYPPGKVDIVVNSSLLERAPDVVAFLRNYETTTAQNNKALAYMQSQEASTDEAAIYFLKEFEDVWTKWVPADVAGKVKAALP